MCKIVTLDALDINYMRQHSFPVCKNGLNKLLLFQGCTERDLPLMLQITAIYTGMYTSMTCTVDKLCSNESKVQIM